jgi:hypothetical protein
MSRDPHTLFREAWELVAKRVNAGKRSKDRIRFFLTDGTTKTFDIPPMRDDQMKEDFLLITFKAINNHPVEALLLSYEAWFVEEDEKVVGVDLDAYLRNTPRPRNHPKRREGVNFYYESADGIMLTALAEIITIKKKKRELARFSQIVPIKARNRMSHFFEKAREYSMDYRNVFSDIFSGN